MEVSSSWEGSYSSTIWMRHGSVGGDDSSSQRMMACMFSSIRLSRLYRRADETRRDGRKHGEQQQQL
jgi:hypothetical protein